MTTKADEGVITAKDLMTISDVAELATMISDGKFKTALNQAPPKEWIKDHPYAKGVKYLPIDKVEVMLDTIFQNAWYAEVREIKQIAQSICAIVRLHYKNPVSSEWLFQDGVGAVPLKTDKNHSAADLAHIKSDAVATGAPAAKSFAIKDAAEELGKLFGRDLNRKDVVGFKSVYQEELIVKNADDNSMPEKSQISPEEELAIEKIAGCRTKSELMRLWISEDFKEMRQSEAVRKAKDYRKTIIESEQEKK